MYRYRAVHSFTSRRPINLISQRLIIYIIAALLKDTRLTEQCDLH